MVKRAIFLFITFLAVGSGELVVAQDPSVQKIREALLNPDSPFALRMTINHPDYLYTEGDLLKIKVLTQQSGYLYLFNITSNGIAHSIFPNPWMRNNAITAGQPIIIPPQGSETGGDATFDLPCGPPFGKEHLVALVTTRPIKVPDFEKLQRELGTQIDLLAPTNRAFYPTASGKKMEWGAAWVTLRTVPKEKIDQARDQFSHRGRLFVLAVGISQYKERRIRNLNACKRDAEAFIKQIKKTRQVEEAILLIDGDATREKIEHAFKNLRQKTENGDDVLIYWSGHGARMRGLIKEEKYTEYLVPYDANLDKLPESVITDINLANWVQALDGRKVAIIFDACHAGGTARKKEKSTSKGISNSPEGFLTYFTQRVAYPTSKNINPHYATLLLSCRADEISTQHKDGLHSVMTHFLLKKMRDEKRLTLNDAFDHLSEVVPEYVQTSYRGYTQHPQIFPRTEKREFALTNTTD